MRITPGWPLTPPSSVKEASDWQEAEPRIPEPGGQTMMSHYRGSVGNSECVCFMCLMRPRRAGFTATTATLRVWTQRSVSASAFRYFYSPAHLPITQTSSWRTGVYLQSLIGSSSSQHLHIWRYFCPKAAKSLQNTLITVIIVFMLFWQTPSAEEDHELWWKAQEKASKWTLPR